MRFALAALGFALGPVLAQGAEPTASHFADVVHEHFAAWDLNHDGKIEGREIDTLMTRRSIHGEAAAALAVLKLRERHTPSAVRPGFTLTAHDVDDLDALSEPVVAIDPAKGPPKPFHAEANYKRCRKMLQSLVPRLYAGSGPNFAAMKQGGIADCYFFCLTGFLAAKHPNKIRDMIQPASNGNYVVKFLDGESFKVAEPTEAELLVNNSSSSLADGIWLCVLEKAVGQRLRTKSKDPAKRTAEPTDAMASGGSTATVMTLYSGHKAKSIKLRDSRQKAARLQELRHELPLTLARGRMASLEMDAEAPGLAKVPGLGYHHAYAILAFDSKADQVTVWNPWGQHFQPKGPEGPEHGFAAEHGIFHITLGTMYKFFSTVHLETTERASADSSNHKPVRHR
jgi:Calpain family cysteine protease